MPIKKNLASVPQEEPTLKLNPVLDVKIMRQSLPSFTNVPLVMSEAAVNKRLKNLDEYIAAKRNLRDREDAISHASQIIETMSKADLKSQTTTKPFMKSLRINKLDRATNSQVIH